MQRPPFGLEPNRAICDACGEIVIRPHKYRGLYLHKGCARKMRMQDYSEEVLAPRVDEAGRILEELLDSNPTSLT